MFKYKLWIIGMILSCFAFNGYSHINPELNNKPANQQAVNFRADCVQATQQVDMDINNVQARLLTGGDVWWNGDDGRYIVPKVDPETNIPERSSIFAGAVWLGGIDPAGNLKVAAQTYGTSSGQTDFWPGPLSETGTVEPDTCARWDKFFEVSGAEIDMHLAEFGRAQNAGVDMDPDLIPDGVKGWPAIGNQFFFDIHRFELPVTAQGLAPFHDQDGDGQYNPEFGDYPRIEIRGCDAPQYPDQMFFWIYNDAGGIHTESQGDAIQMEIQVQAFAYESQDELNDMTFQRYKLINRAIESIDSMFFAMWVDADLGCFDDDYIGCDTSRSLMYIYNEDGLDGQTGCDCAGVNTYCDEIPILGVDYFRGPLDENGDELGMSSFTYYNNGGIGTPAPGTTDPDIAAEFYNYLSGSWQDGTPFSFGESAYNPGSTDLIDYAFTGEPDDNTSWSMCTVAGLGNGDRRTVQASGPFKLDPGAVNELIIGVVWVPDVPHPCPDITPLLAADDLAQSLFNNCFDITDGPDAPDVDFIELDRELIAVLSNDEITSNNAFEEYSETDLRAPEGTIDSLYRFEGYLIYQLAGPEVSLSEIDNPEKSRLVAQVDKKNGIADLFNWEQYSEDGFSGNVFVPTKVVSAADDGLLHTFKFTEDQFAPGDRRLVNHKKYYYTSVAYAYNNYENFDPSSAEGQRAPFLTGRRNGNVYVPIPRASVTEVLNSSYGDGAVITRIDGMGAGGNFLDISQEERESMLLDDFDGEITYLPGAGPIKVEVYNPFEAEDGEFELTFIDEDMSNDVLDDSVTWKLTNLINGDVISSELTIFELNEQLISEYGFSVAIVQSEEPGDNPTSVNNGAIGIEVEYEDPDGVIWLDHAGEGGLFLDYIVQNIDNPVDLNATLSSMGSGEFVPYTLCEWAPPEIPNNPAESYITPAWTDGGNNSSLVQPENPLSTLNNVDIVYTSDKTKWSRCVVVETASNQYTDDNVGLNLETELDANIASELEFDEVLHMNLRGVPSVGQNDSDGDGKADPDGETREGKPLMGMGWFPGYAVDVESGERLNIFFGENTTYDDQALPADAYDDGRIITRDMIFNPSSQRNIITGGFNLYNAYLGGQHMVYVTDRPYDEGVYMYSRLAGNETNLRKLSGLRNVKWASIPLTAQGARMLSYNDGLIPNDVTIKVRVDNGYDVVRLSVDPEIEGEIPPTEEFNGYPTYRFKFEGIAPGELVSDVEINNALDLINVVPNPYYGYSAYETDQFTNTVKITNLPAKCVITIYSIDGKFIRQYNRDEVGASQSDRNNAPVLNSQITPALEWDIKNSKGIPVASGVYLIHVKAGNYERVIKWFGVGRQFDPSGL